MIWLAVLGCGGSSPPFDADLRVYSESPGKPPLVNYVLDVTVENDTTGPRWVLLPRKLENDTSEPFSVEAVRLVDHPFTGAIEYHLEAENGATWIAWELAPGERRTHRTEVHAWRADTERVELWLVADVRLAGGPTLAGLAKGELAPPPVDQRPKTELVMDRTLRLWEAPHRGFVVFDEGERREIALQKP